MKKLHFLYAGLFFLMLSINVNAQSKTGAAYFTRRFEGSPRMMITKVNVVRKTNNRYVNRKIKCF
jgi:hypothetical protein